MQSSASTVDEYIASLPEDRRAAISVVRKVILDNVDADIEEGMQYGMIGYYVSRAAYPDGYHCDPRQALPYANLGSQKNHMAIYLMCLYAQGALRDWFESAWTAAGKKLDMGKSCIRFKKLDDLALDVLVEALRRVSTKNYISFYESAISSTQRSKPAKAPVKKLSAKKPLKKAIKNSRLKHKPAS